MKSVFRRNVQRARFSKGVKKSRGRIACRLHNRPRRTVFNVGDRSKMGTFPLVHSMTSFGSLIA